MTSAVKNLGSHPKVGGGDAVFKSHLKTIMSMLLYGDGNEIYCTRQKSTL